MPGIERLSVDLLLPVAERALELGHPGRGAVPGDARPSARARTPREAWNDDNLMCRAIRAIKRHCPELGVIGDVALDPYTSHGQDGLLRDGVILNDETIAALVRQAACLAARRLRHRRPLGHDGRPDRRHPRRARRGRPASGP